MLIGQEIAWVANPSSVMQFSHRKKLLEFQIIPLAHPPTLKCAILGATFLSPKPIFRLHNKHIEVDYLFILGSNQQTTVAYQSYLQMIKLQIFELLCSFPMSYVNLLFDCTLFLICS